MDINKATSVKAHSYVNYGRAADLSYQGHSADAKAIAEKDRRVQVTLAAKAATDGLKTESRDNFKQMVNRDPSPADMINKLKASSVALGFHNKQA